MADSDSRKSGWPEPASDLLQQIFRRRGMATKILGARAIASWSEVAGPTVARDSRAVEFSGGVLTVWAREPSTAHTLQMLSPKLLEAMARKLGAPVVKRLRFQSGPIPSVTPQSAPADFGEDREALAAKLAAVELTEAERAEVDRLTRGIDNETVRGWTRANVEARIRLDRVRADEGWRPCEACGVLADPTRGGLCASCETLWTLVPATEGLAEASYPTDCPEGSDLA